jgi:ribosomal RNA assembly protein
MEYVKIAEDRIGAVIGKEGEMKSRIEKVIEVKLMVNSKEGIVKVENAGSDPLGEWKARDIVKAISYGISPDTAMSLKDDEQTLILINLHDIVGRSKKAVSRQKARIIGRQGKTKAHISELTGAAVSLKGKHVAIVGRMEEAIVAKDAVEALARGLPHGVVYKAVEKKCSSMKMQRNVEMWRQK